MATLYSSIALVSLIVAACWFITKCLGDRHLGLQDSTLRIGLLLSLAAPVFCWVYSSPYKLSIPILSAIKPEDNQPIVREQIVEPVRSGQDNTNVATTGQVPVDLPLENEANSRRSNLETTIEESTSDSPWSLRKLLSYWPLIVWAIGASIACVQIIRSYVRSISVLRKSSLLNDAKWQNAFAAARDIIGINAQRVQLRSSAQIDSPLLVGIRQPAILIPTHLLEGEFSPEACEHIVTHELVHVQRGDMLENLLHQIVVALWWWHPLVHWLKNKTGTTRELICDVTTSHYQCPEDYAETLLQLTVSRGYEPAFALGITGKSCDLERRVAWILTKPQLGQIRSMNPNISRVSFAGICVVLMTVACIQFTPAVAQEPNKATSGEESKKNHEATSKDKSIEPTAENMMKLPPLVSGTKVQGHVKLPDGNPATNANVYLLYIPPGGVGLTWTPVSTQSDGEGAFTFSKVAPGRYTFWATTDQFVSHFNAIVGRELSVQESPAKLDVIEAKLHNASTYRLKVTDADTGLPVEGATIQPFPAPLIPVKVTDANGVAEYRNLTADDWHFTVHKPGYAYTLKSATRQPLGSRTELDVQLAKGGTLSGKVVDQDGQPVAGCNMIVQIQNSWPGPEFPEVKSGTDGTYVIHDIPIYTECRISADIETHEVIIKEFSISKSDHKLGLDLLAPKRKQGVSARFQITDSEGHPIQNAKLKNYGFRRVRFGTSDAEGNCQLENMYTLSSKEESNGFQVVISAEGYLESQVPVSESSTLESSPLKVILKSTPVFVGRMLTPEGRPLKDVVVSAVNPQNRSQLDLSARTDANGRFVINEITEEVLLSFSPPAPYLGRIEARYKNQPGGVRDIVLEYQGRLRVRAVDAVTGDELPRYNVRIGYAEDYEASGYTRGYSYGFPSALGEGVNVIRGGAEFQMDDQRIGAPYMVTVSAEGYAPTRLPRVPAIKSAEAPLTLVQMHKLNAQNSMIVTGTLRDEDKTVANAQVRLVSTNKPQEIISWNNLEGGHFKNQPECTQYLETTSDNQGRFEFKDVLRSNKTIEIYYFVSNGDQRFRNLQLDSSLTRQNFDLVAPPMVTLHIKIDPKHYPEAEYVSISLPYPGDNKPAHPVAFQNKTIKFHQFLNGNVVTLRLPLGEYQFGISGKSARVGNTNFVSSKSLYARKLVLTAEEPSLNLDL